MKVMTRQVGLIVGLFLVAGTGSPAISQSRRPAAVPDRDTPRFMVPTLRASEKGLGMQAADAIRGRIAGDFDIKRLYVIPKGDIDNNLVASGFSADTAPNPITARLLAQALRADEYLEGTVTRSPAGVKIESRMVLTRDNKMTQPLPPAEGRNVAEAARLISRSLAEARKQLAEERKCEQAIVANNNEVAMTHARAAIAAYPQSTIARVCLAQAMVNLKAPPDSIIAVTTKAIEIDPRNVPALQLAAQAYQDMKNDDKAVETWTRVLALDPANLRLQTQVVNVLAASGKAGLAEPIIEDAVQQNPGEPELLRLRWLILLTTRNWKKAIAAGEDLVKSDTAAADTVFFTRLAAAYAADSQPQKAAEATARGVAKFPNNADLWSLHSQTLRLAGQNQQSAEAARRSVQINPKVENGYVRLAQAQIELGQSDSASASLKQAVANGADAAFVGQIMLVQGNNCYKAAQVSKTRAEYQKCVAMLWKADSVAPTPQGKFLLGVSAFWVGDGAVRENQSAKSCELAQLAQDSFLTAETNVPAGGSIAPDAAKQILGALAQYQSAVEGQLKKFCKKK